MIWGLDQPVVALSIYTAISAALPRPSSGMSGLNSLRFQANKERQVCKVWYGLHVFPTEDLPEGPSLGIIMNGLSAPVA